MDDILKLARVQLIVIPIFIFFKFIRSPVLNSSSPAIFKLILLSLPNFFEAIIGVLTVTGLGLLLNDRLSRKYQLKPSSIYKVAVFIAGTYVVLQELNIIKLRTNGTTDQNDIIFSIIGLIVGYLIILRKKPFKSYY